MAPLVSMPAQYVGPIIGSLIATFLYSLLKAFDYSSVVLGQDSDAANGGTRTIASRVWAHHHGFSHSQRQAMLASGMKQEDLARAEAGMVAQQQATEPMQSRMSESTLAPGQHANIKQEASNAPAGQQSSMTAGAQDGGGIGAPGSHGHGLGMFSMFRKHQRH